MLLVGTAPAPMAASTLDSRNKFPDAFSNNTVTLNTVIPQFHRAVAMPEKEIAVHIGANDTHFFSAPPIYLQRSPVVLSDQARNLDHAFTATNSVAPSEICNRLLHRIHLLDEDYSAESSTFPHLQLRKSPAEVLQ